MGVGSRGALWPVTPRPAWMVDGGLESSCPPDCPPLPTLSMESHGPLEASGYIVYQSDIKPVGFERWDGTHA